MFTNQWKLPSFSSPLTMDIPVLYVTNRALSVLVSTSFKIQGMQSAIFIKFLKAHHLPGFEVTQ